MLLLILLRSLASRKACKEYKFMHLECLMPQAIAVPTGASVHIVHITIKSIVV